MTKISIESEKSQKVVPLVKTAIGKEIKILQLGIERTKKNLKELEEKFEMKTDEFFARYIKGEMGDKMDFIKWAGEYETLLKLQEDYSELKETEIC